MADNTARGGRSPSISSVSSATPSTTLPPPSSHPAPTGSKHDNLNFKPEPRPWSTRSFGYQYLPFRGIVHDLTRRAPFYVSDWTEGFKPKNYERVVGATIKMFFLNLFPCLAYIIDMYVRTDGAYGVNEGILSSAIAALTFALFSVQPLTIVGVTGLINLFNYTTFDILRDYDVDFLQFQAWVLIWSAITHWITAVLNISDYTRFITDMTSETFGLYVGVIYIQKGIELLVYEFDDGTGQAGWFSVVVAILFALSVYFIERSGTLSFGPFWFRKFLVDYAFAAAVVFYTGFVHIPGYIKSSDIQYLPITKSFAPTVNRDWVVPFWDLPVKWVFVALPFGLLVTLLFYFDNNVSSVMAQSRGFPVKRPAGFHWDFFLLGCTTFVAGILGLPAPNGLVPQAPVHTESLCVTKMVPRSTPLSAGGFFEGSVREAKEKGEKGEGMKVVRTRLVEQRISHFAMGLLIMGCMSRPLLVVFGLMSRAMFAGIFIVVGWGSVEGNGIVHKTLYLLRDPNLIPADHPLKEIKKSSILKFIGVQWLFFAAIIAISETIAGIGFPVIIILLIPLRHFTLPKYFTPFELSVLDAPTANSAAVLVSIGGPLESEGHEGTTKRRKRDEETGGGGKTSARFREQSNEEGAEKDREEGLRRREAREQALRDEGVVGGEGGVQRPMDIHR
ncbi:Bor1p [Sporobolomyces salmoneus]|uniref:Bor1p n=1 Tax=Sporobolomyces salmoneus TaxID=183962 RepID=UPI00316C47ED